MTTSEFDDARATQPRQHFGKYLARVVQRRPPVVDVPGSVGVELPQFSITDPSGAILPMTCVARPTMLHGAFFVPEEGDHVWVSFHGGDLAFPIYEGQTSPEKAAPANPEGEQPTPEQHVLRSKQHVLCLDDTAGGERIVLQDAG